MARQWNKHQQRDTVLKRLDQVPRARQIGPRPPVYQIYERQITTKLWANFTEWGDLVWRFDIRSQVSPEKSTHYFSAEEIDLLILSLLRTKKLIRAVERRRFLRRFFPWM